MNDYFKKGIDVDTASASILLPNNIRFNVSPINTLTTDSNSIVIEEDKDTVEINATTHTNHFYINVDSKDISIEVVNPRLISILKEDTLVAYIQIPLLFDSSTNTPINHHVEVDKGTNIICIHAKDTTLDSEVKAIFKLSSMTYKSKMAFMDKFEGYEFWYDMSDYTIYKTKDIRLGREPYFTMPEGYRAQYGYEAPRLVSEDRILHTKGYSKVKECLINGNDLEEVGFYDQKAIVKVSNKYWIGINTNNNYSAGPKGVSTVYSLMKRNGEKFEVLDTYELVPKTTSTPAIYDMVPHIAQETKDRITLYLLSDFWTIHYDASKYLSIKINKNTEVFTFEDIEPGKAIIYKDDRYTVIHDYDKRVTYVNGKEYECLDYDAATVIAVNDKEILYQKYNTFSFSYEQTRVLNVETGEISSANMFMDRVFSLNPTYIGMGTSIGYHTYVKIPVKREFRRMTLNDVVKTKNMQIAKDYVYYSTKEGYVDINVKDIPKDVRFFGDDFNSYYSDENRAIGQIGDMRYSPFQVIPCNCTENLRITYRSNDGGYMFFKEHYFVYEPTSAETVKVSTICNTTRKVIKYARKSIDTKRVASRKTSRFINTIRKVIMVGEYVVKTDTLRGVNNVYAFSCNTRRSTIKDYSKKNAITIRKVEDKAINYIDAKRNVYKNHNTTSDLKRITALPATASINTIRSTSISTTASSDTKREVDKFYNVDSYMDLLRIATKKSTNVSDMKRIVRRTVDEVVKIDAIRKVENKAEVEIGSIREVEVLREREIKAERIVDKIAEEVIDIVREVIREDVIDIEVDTEREVEVRDEIVTDICRNVGKNYISIVDTQREAIKRIELRKDLERKLEKEIEEYFKTIRKVVGEIEEVKPILDIEMKLEKGVLNIVKQEFYKREVEEE